MWVKELPMRMLKLLIRVSECLDRYEIVVVLELVTKRSWIQTTFWHSCWDVGRIAWIGIQLDYDWRNAGCFKVDDSQESRTIWFLKYDRISSSAWWGTRRDRERLHFRPWTNYWTGLCWRLHKSTWLKNSKKKVKRKHGKSRSTEYFTLMGCCCFT